METQGCVVSKNLKNDIKQRIFTRQSSQKTARSDLPRIGEAVTTTEVEATNTSRYSLKPHLATLKAKHLKYGGREECVWLYVARSLKTPSTGHADTSDQSEGCPWAMCMHRHESEHPKGYVVGQDWTVLASLCKKQRVSALFL